MKPHVFRQGDIVRAPDRMIAHVGYRLTYTDAHEAVQHTPEDIAAVNALLDYAGAPHTGRARDRVERALAFAKVAADMQAPGGDVRSVHFAPCAVVGECMVVSKRTVQTGTYYAPSAGSGWNYWGDDYDSGDTGGLSQRQTHVILKLRPLGRRVYSDADTVEVLASDVVPGRVAS